MAGRVDFLRVQLSDGLELRGFQVEGDSNTQKTYWQQRW